MFAFTAHCPNTGEILQNGVCVCANTGETVQNEVCTCPVGQAVQNGACASRSNWFHRDNTGQKKRQKTSKIIKGPFKYYVIKGLGGWGWLNDYVIT